jgi:2-phosphoglycerate kinase
VFSHLPAEQVIEGLRLFPSNMQPHSFSKRQLAAVVLMLDEEEKNVSASDKKKQKTKRGIMDPVQRIS